MTAFVGEGSSMNIWVAKRSENKSTYPGMLDNSVGGGMPSGMGAYTTLVKESQEEANLLEELVKLHAMATGVVSCSGVRDKHAGGGAGLLQVRHLVAGSWDCLTVETARSAIHI